MSLHKTVEYIKKIGLIIAGIILVMIIFNLLTGIISKLTPKKEAAPTVSFGQLPPILFPQSADQSIKPTYSLETISGEFPVLPDRVKVYPIEQSQPSILALRNFQNIVPQEFSNQPKALSETVYQWASASSPYKILTYNILTQDVSLTSAYLTDSDFYTSLGTQDQQRAIGDATSFLQRINEFPIDIDDTKTQTTLFSFDPTSHTLQPSQSLGSTQIVQVDFFEKDIDKLLIYYPDPLHSLISAIVANDNVVAAQAMHKPIDMTTSATYPIKTAAQAFKMLQDGKAFIASPSNPPVSIINIRDITLAYYIGSGQQLYVMPIIVLKGDNGFYAYVSAIDDQWIKK